MTALISLRFSPCSVHVLVSWFELGAGVPPPAHEWVPGLLSSELLCFALSPPAQKSVGGVGLQLVPFLRSAFRVSLLQYCRTPLIKSAG